MKRKLTTIFFADGVRFGTLMAADEAGTLARLRRYREIMGAAFQKFDGRQVNTWGDAVIAEFPSVVESVRCAVEIQDAISAENRDLPEEKQMWFRIGINLGDVMVDGEDLYGDGVNVAARLESMAEPGGVMVSGTVYALAHKQLALAFDYVGEQTMKSLDEPVPSYRIRIGGANAEPAAPEGAAGDQARPAPEEDAPTRTTAAARTGLVRVVRWAENALDWLGRQPTRIQGAAAMIAFFFAINLLFSGIATPWFIFPSFPFAFMIWRHYNREKNRRSDGG
jgi:adenylate cyclase